MKKNILFAGALSMLLLAGNLDCHAADWVNNNFDKPNKNLEANFYDSESVKVKDKTLSWTEKFVLTKFGEKSYTKHLLQFPACRKNIEKNGNVTYHTMDFEIKEGKFRLVAKRNYNKADELVCTDKEMGTEFNTSWQDIERGSPMYDRYYLLVTKYKLGNI